MKRLVVFLVLLASMLSIKAAEMYVVISPDGSTITFYYDDLKSSREGTTYKISDGRIWQNNYLEYDNRNDMYEEGVLVDEHDSDWYSDELDKITLAVFNSSFKNARPTSTKRWFWKLRKLQRIENLQSLHTSEVTDMGEKDKLWGEQKTCSFTKILDRIKK